MDHTPASCRKDQVVIQIEDLISTLLRDLNEGQRLVIPLRTTRSSLPRGTSPNRNNYCFPGNSYRVAWRFTTVLRILDIIHETLLEDKTVSKRDVFYQDPDLFDSQSVVNKYLDNIALTFNVSINDLNVIAEAKGLLAGAIQIAEGDNSSDDNICINSEGVSVPRSCQFPYLLIPPDARPRFLLLIEKKATFHVLSRSDFHIRHNCVLLTGQGYPDLATRAFLHYFNNHLAPSTPCYALVDFDPDGLCIYNVYTRGSQALSNEVNLIVPNLRFLGVRTEDAMSLLAAETTSIDSQHKIETTEGHATNLDNTVTPSHLSQHERQRARGLLKRLTAETKPREEEEAEQQYMRERWGWQESDQQAFAREQAEILIRELQLCLMMGYKVETQILDRRPGGLEKWVLERVEERV